MEDLLPRPDEAPRCSDHTRALGVDPCGTGITADLVVAVEAPLPWPKPVFALAALAPVPDLVAGAAQPSRVLATVAPDAGPARRATAWRRGAGSTERAVYRFEPTGLTTLLEALLAGDTADRHRLDEDPPPFEALVCTQGSHDRCCGADGSRLATELVARGLTVHRVSHTGGHRFAPTALTFPDGRAWAHLDVDAVERLARGERTPDLVARCRGWWGAGEGPGQVAERAVLAAVGPEWERARRTVTLTADADGTTSWSVSGDRSTWAVTVRSRREVPTIACAVPGGLPAKRGIEYEVVSAQRVDADAP